MFSRRSTLLFFACVTLALSFDTAADPDMWWHLRTGELIVGGEFPRGDVFSFSVPGREWITHEWLSQVVMWLTWDVAGTAGLTVLFGVITAAAYGVAFGTSEARSTVTAAVTALGALASFVLVGPRPQMLNLLGLAVTIWLFESVRRGQFSATRLWWFVPLIALWANFHSGYLLGVVVAAVYAVGEWTQRRYAPEAAADAAMIATTPKVAVVGFLAAALNPSTWHIWWYPIATLRSEAMRLYIAEWHAPDFQEARFWPALLLMLITVVGAVRSRHLLRFTPALLLVGSGVAALQSIRNIPIFAVVAVVFVSPLVAHAIDTGGPLIDGLRVQREKPMRGVSALLGGLAVVLAMSVVAPTVARADERIGARYPSDAVDALVASGLADTPGFNDYGWGGYLIYHDVEVFIDGRADVYGDAFMHDYFRTAVVAPGWNDVLDEYDIEWALLPPGSTLGEMLGAVADWTEVYADDVAVIFARCGDACPEVVTPG